jgi:hypothetical protein
MTNDYRDTISSAYYVGVNARKNSPYCIYTQIISFPQEYLNPRKENNFNSNNSLILDYNLYLIAKTNRIIEETRKLNDQNNIQGHLEVCSSIMKFNNTIDIKIDKKPSFEFYGGYDMIIDQVFFN